MNVPVRHLASLAAAAALATVATTAAAAPTATSASASDAPPVSVEQARPHATSTSTRRWYRISATVAARHRLTDTVNGVVRRDQRSIWSVRSNTAVLLFRQCAMRRSIRSGLSGRQLATVAGSRGESCASIRRELRRDLRGKRGRDRRETLDLIRALREDVRFTANGTTDWVIHSNHYTLPVTGVPASSGELIDCAPWGPFQAASVSGVRTTGGRLTTGSLHRDGVAPDVGARPPSYPTTFSRPEYPGCFDPDTGNLLRGGMAFEMESSVSLREMANGLAVGRLQRPLAAVPIREPRVGRRFWRSFTLRDSVTRRASTAVTSEVATVKTTVRFQICPGGGRNVRAC